MWVTMAAGKPRAARGLSVPDLIRLSGEHSELSIPLKEYFEALRAGDEKLRAADERFMLERDSRYREVGAERDQRYAEVKAAEEKALKVKETADLKALDLASQIQTYKDEKANELREQISSERSLYVTRSELSSAVRELQAAIKPLAESVQNTTGRTVGSAESRTESRLNQGQLVAYGLLAVAILTLVLLYVTKK
jgi:hypothetical protein